MKALAEIITKLEQNTNHVLLFVKNISTSDFNKGPEGKWTVLEILEHVLITEKLVVRLLSQPGTQTSDSEEILGDEKLKRIIVDLRGRKVQAPELFHPKGKIRDLATFEKGFTENRNHLTQSLINGKISVDNRIQKHPFLGEMTIRDWLHFIPHHTQRHLEQIKDILGAN